MGAKADRFEPSDVMEYPERSVSASPETCMAIMHEIDRIVRRERLKKLVATFASDLLRRGVDFTKADWSDCDPKETFDSLADRVLDGFV